MTDLTLEIEVDDPRRMMLDELEDEFGEDKVRKVVEKNIIAQVHTVVNRLYDNRDRVRKLEDEIE